MRPDRRLLVTVVLLVAFVVVGRPTAVAGAATCAQPTTDHVAVVIDFGTVPGAPAGISSECVSFAPRATGIDALKSAAPGQVATDNSGKVCGILGYPANPSPTNCSAPQDGHIRYWAYFLGTDSGWEYSAAGAAAVRVAPDIVQGWRYVDVPVSGGTSGIVPPRNLVDGRETSLWSSTCPEVPPPPPPPTTPALEPPPNAPGTSVPGVIGSPSPTKPGASRAGRAPSTTGSAATGPSSTATPRGTTSLANGAITGLQSGGRAKLLTPAEIRSATDTASSKGSRLGEILGIAIGVLVIAVLLGFGTWRSRRRLDQD